MSAQTGEASPIGPASTRVVDRARFRVTRLKTEPNPIWIRELKQAARLARTPVILTVVAILMTLLIASIGGIVSTNESPATTGQVIFQVFFSIAFFVVTLVGPAVAANSIASEREGRTWEAVLLTGLSPGTITRGKFLAAYTAIGMYIVMLAPVGALPFLFGGVTATEVIVAFVFLFVVALLSVAFGLAISSKMGSLRAAILVTLLLAFPMALFAFFGLGLGLSIVAHKQWFNVPEGPPVWLPLAYQHAPFDAAYVVFLVLLPLACMALPAWFLYEVTIANLTSVTDDRSTGLKRWFLIASPMVTVACAVPVFTVTSSDRIAWACFGLGILFAFFKFNIFLFQGEPIGPSRRVKAHWVRDKAGAFKRFIGPGIARGMLLVIALGLLCTGTFLVVCIAVLRGAPMLAVGPAQVGAFGAYGLGFFVFTAGLGAFLRSRAATPFAARVLLFTILFAIAVGPWIVAAIAGLLADHAGEGALLIASPSPFYIIVMSDAIKRASGSEGFGSTAVQVGMMCAAGWTMFGFLLFVLAERRANRIIVDHDKALLETDRILAAEDEAAARPVAPVADAPAPPTDAPAPATDRSPADAAPADAAPAAAQAAEGPADDAPNVES